MNIAIDSFEDQRDAANETLDALAQSLGYDNFEDYFVKDTIPLHEYFLAYGNSH